VYARELLGRSRVTIRPEPLPGPDAGADVSDTFVGHRTVEAVAAFSTWIFILAPTVRSIEGVRA
jgi:hypothetical protein